MTFHLSPNLQLLFGGAGDDPVTQLRAVAAAGFRFVDLWGCPPDPAAFREVLNETGVQVTVLTAAVSELGDPHRLAENMEGIRTSLAQAEAIGCRWLVVTGGSALAHVTPTEQRAAIVDALRTAADVVAGTGVGILLENLNSRVDHVGAFLDTALETFAIVREVDRSDVRVLFDAYHSLVMGEQVADVLRGSADLVEHVQIADVPGRHEPGTGEVDWARLLDDLEDAGYSGPLGLEYWPTTETIASIEHLQRVLAARR